MRAFAKYLFDETDPIKKVRGSEVMDNEVVLARCFLTHQASEE